MRRAAPRFPAVLLALALGGCAQAQAGFPAVARPASAPASESVFSVLWWEKADGGEGLAYRPLEPASPEADPINGTVFSATSDGKVRAFGRGRELLWEFDAKGPFTAGPTLAEDRLYLSTSEGKMVALDVATGAPIWQYATGEELMTRPVVEDGLVLAMSVSDALFAVDQETGTWKWQYRRDPPVRFTVRGAARPLVVDGRVFAGFADGFAVALEARDGSVVWAKPLTTGAEFLDLDADPVADDWGRVCFASYSGGIACLDAGLGTTVWTQRRPGVTSLALDRGANRLYAGGTGFVSCFAVDSGQARWNLELGRDRFVSGLALDFGWLMVSTGPGPLLFLDPRSGRFRKAFDPGHGVSAAPQSLPGGEAVILSNRGVLYGVALAGTGRR